MMSWISTTLLAPSKMKVKTRLKGLDSPELALEMRTERLIIIYMQVRIHPLGLGQ